MSVEFWDSVVDEYTDGKYEIIKFCPDFVITMEHTLILFHLKISNFLCKNIVTVLLNKITKMWGRNFYLTLSFE